METRSPLPSRLIAVFLCLLTQTVFAESSVPSQPAVETPAPTAQHSSATNDRHVVVVVWDGMRPDLVTERNAPTLWKLAREGVTFRHHHSVYPTLTNVNGAAIATGAWPDRNGVLANHEYRARIDPRQAFDHGRPEVIKKADETSGGKYLALPTAAEVVRAAGRRTAVIGTKAVAFLHDRHAAWSSGVSRDSVIRFAAAPMPPATRDQLFHLLGSFLTEPTNTAEQRNIYATRAMTGILWCDELPAFSLLWLSDPDVTQHAHAPGAEPSMRAIRNSDRNLAAILDAISKKNKRDQTDLLVVSDHGFSTVERGVDLVKNLRAAAFDAVTTFEQAPKPGQILVVGNGGTAFFYVIEHDRAVAARLVEWLQRSDFAGPIFARENFEGTFSLDSIHLSTPEAPDLVVSMRWNRKPNRFRVPGQIVTGTSSEAVKGTHGSLSAFDVHNTLIAAGPDFRRGLMSDLPSGNIDLAPTVLHILGLKTPQKFDGRVLSEAMTGDSVPPPAATETLEATRKFPSGQWRQHLRISRVGETTYIDEGNGAFETSR